MQCHGSVHSADALVVPGMSLVSQIICHLATTPARLFVSQLLQLFCDRFIFFSSLGRVTICTTAHLHRATSLSFTQPEFLDCITNQLTSFPYLESFFSIISFRTSCSRLRFAYICFRRRFSSSSSFIRFTSLMLIPPYLAFHL